MHRYSILRFHQIYLLVLLCASALFIAMQPVSASMHGSLVACPKGSNLGDGCNDVAVITNATISGTTLTIGGSVSGANVAPGMILTGASISLDTVILSGSGSSWTLSTSNTVASGETMTASAVAPPANAATTQHSDFFSGYANQTAGKSFNAGAVAAINWNPPGIDYATGPRFVPTKDPANIGSDPLDNSVCAYISATNRVICQNGSGAGFAIIGYDFTLHGGVYLQVQSTLTGPKIITDNVFVEPTYSGYFAISDQSPGRTTLMYNSCNAGGVSGSAAWNACFALGGPVIDEYNTFVGSSRTIDSSNNVLSTFNYVECLGTGGISNPEHVEQITNAPPTMTSTTFQDLYNVFLQPASCVTGGGPGVTTPAELIATDLTVSIAFTQDHTIHVVNTPGGISAAGVQLAYAATPSPTITNNLYAAWGSYYCNISGKSGNVVSGSATFSGNIDLVDGSSVNGFDGNGTACKGSENNP